MLVLNSTEKLLSQSNMQLNVSSLTIGFSIGANTKVMGMVALEKGEEENVIVSREYL